MLRWGAVIGLVAACEGAGVGDVAGSEETTAAEASSDETSSAASTTAASGDGTTTSSSSEGSSESGGEGDDDGTSTGAEPEGSRCEVSDTHIACERQYTALDGHPIYWQVPVGVPPRDGWPAVVLFHGSFFTPELTWEGGASMPFGGFQQLRLQAALLDHGFALITPEASSGVAWSTNFPDYEGSADHELMLALLDAIAAGEFGPIDSARLYATGISSGGYMTSRMAVSYAGRFRALAVNAGSYATCTNVLCSIPDPLPDDHPPTLFAHGQLDVAVPIATMHAYADQLDAQGLEHLEVVDAGAGHRWIEAAPEAILAWFVQHE